MTRGTIYRSAALGLALALSVTPGQGPGAAVFLSGAEAPEGRRISERVAEVGMDEITAHVPRPAPKVQLESNRQVGWTVSAPAAGDGAAFSQNLISNPSVTSDLRLDLEYANLSWVCTVEMPRAGLGGTTSRGTSALRAFLSTGGLLDGSILSGPAGISVELSGSSESETGEGTLGAVRAMIAEGETPHTGKIEGAFNWNGGLVVRAAREWSGDANASSATNRLGVHRGFAGEDWSFEFGADLHTRYIEEESSDGLLVNVAGRLTAISGMSLTAGAAYESRFNADDGFHDLSVRVGADLTEMLANAMPGVSAPRLQLQAMASADSRTQNAEWLQSPDMSGKIELGWNF